MKTNFLLLLITFLTFPLLAQNVGINNDNTDPDASALLDVKSTNKGVLIPRISLTMTSSAAPVTAPATALLVYNTASVNDVTPGFYSWTGSAWKALGSDNLGNHTATTNIQLAGNRLTNNGTAGISIDNAGNVGIGNPTPSTTLDVNGIIKSGQNGTDGELQIYSEQGATDFTYTIRPNAAATQNNTFTLPVDDGAPGQVLTTDGAGNFSWTTPSGGGSGVVHALEAIATIGQTINIGVSITDGTGTIRFDNELVNNPAIGTWSANDSVYTVVQAGLFLIDAHVRSTQTLTSSSAIAPYIEIRNSANVRTHKIYGTGVTQVNTFHTDSRGRGEVQGIVRLNVGDTLRIRCNNTSNAVNAPISLLEQSTRLSIVKLL